MDVRELTVKLDLYRMYNVLSKYPYVNTSYFLKQFSSVSVDCKSMIWYVWYVLQKLIRVYIPIC